MVEDWSIHNKRVRATDLANRSSDDFRGTCGRSPMDSIAPFRRDEIILGRRVGAGSFSFVYDIQDFNLSGDQSDVYTEEHIKKREAIAKSLKNGTKYVMKCLKEKLEDSVDGDLFPCAAQDIIQETEMLATLSHPNIIKLHGVAASRHDAFLDGASEFFIILEKLDCTLAEKIKGWTKNSFDSSRSFKSLRKSFSGGALDKLEKSGTPSASVDHDEGGSLHSRIRVAASLAGAVDYLHSQGIIFRDLKPNNVGFDKENNLKLFDFGLARFMPPHGDAYEDVHEMSGSGTPRYSSPECLFHQPYNLKADVYSFSVVLWEIMNLKKPFAKYKQRKELERALSKFDSKSLDIKRRWPQPIQNIIKSGLSKDLWARPVMSELCRVLSDCTSKRVENCESNVESNDILRSTRKQDSENLIFRRLSSKRGLQKLRSSFNSDKSKSDTSGSIADHISYEDFLRQEGEKWEQSIHSLDSSFEDYLLREKEGMEAWRLLRGKTQFVVKLTDK